MTGFTGNVFDDAVGMGAAPPLERDRSQMPLWPELELELESALQGAPTQGEAEAPQLEALPATDPPIHQPEFVEVAAKAPDTQPVIKTDDSIFAAALIAVSSAESTAVEHRLEGRAAGFPDADSELGQRLLATRERLEISREEVARRTHIAPALVRAIEEGKFERLGASVFARGYLRSYARAVELPDAVVSSWESRVQRVMEAAPAPSLAATSPRRSSRQVASPIVYTLLTALIAVPAYYGVRQAQRSPLPAVSSPTAVMADATNGTGTPAPSNTTQARDSAGSSNAPGSGSVPPADAWRQPVMASLTPMLGERTDAESTPVPLDMHQIGIKLSAPSWIEIITPDGRVIEQGLLPAGTDRRYSVPRSARMRVGDVSAVELSADGKVINLVPLARGNVAAWTLGEAG